VVANWDSRFLHIFNGLAKRRGVHH
jgi:hypothetical protein